MADDTYNGEYADHPYRRAFEQSNPDAAGPTPEEIEAARKKLAESEAADDAEGKPRVDPPRAAEEAEPPANDDPAPTPEEPSKPVTPEGPAPDAPDASDAAALQSEGRDISDLIGMGDDPEGPRGPAGESGEDSPGGDEMKDAATDAIELLRRQVELTEIGNQRLEEIKTGIGEIDTTPRML